MTPQPVADPSTGSISFPLLILARIYATAIFMPYPACLSVLLAAWQAVERFGALRVVIAFVLLDGAHSASIG